MWWKGFVEQVGFELGVKELDRVVYGESRESTGEDDVMSTEKEKSQPDRLG